MIELTICCKREKGNGQYTRSEVQKRKQGIDLLADVQLVFYDGVDVLPAHCVLSGLESRLFLVEKLVLVSKLPMATCTASIGKQQVDRDSSDIASTGGGTR